MALQQLEHVLEGAGGGQRGTVGRAVQLRYGDPAVAVWGRVVPDGAGHRHAAGLPAARRAGRRRSSGSSTRVCPIWRPAWGQRRSGWGSISSNSSTTIPQLSQHVYLYHPDLQGPMNVCEMLWGSSLYVDLYDKPDLVRDFLSLITETYIAFMRRWDEIVPVDRCPQGHHRIADISPAIRAGRPRQTPRGVTTNYAVHWSMLHRGRIMIRERRVDESFARDVRRLRPALRPTAARRARRRGDSLLRSGRSSDREIQPTVRHARGQYDSAGPQQRGDDLRPHGR